MTRAHLEEEVPLPAEFRVLLSDLLMWGASERDWKESTQTAYRRRITAAYRWMRWTRDVDLIEATTTDVRAWLATMPATAATRNFAVQALAGLWVFLEETGRWEGRHPTADIRAMRKPKTLPKALARDQRERVLVISQAAGHRWHAAVVLALYEGLRATEVRTLEWTAVEGDWQWLRVLRKGRKEHVVPLHPAAVEALRAWRTECPSARWVFPSPLEDRDEPMSDGWMRSRFRAMGDLADVPGLHPHQLRHTFATDLIEAGVDLTVVQELMAHENPATTSIYLRMRPVRLVEALGRIA